jgi:chemotaxis methyl-accepting protein methylase
MIYFDDRVRDALVKDCHRLLRPGGLLFVGKSEGLHNTSQMFDRAGPSIYKKIG